MIEFFTQHEQTIYFLVLCTFLGVELIANVPAVLHTPLMSGANAISGIILIGSLIIMFKIEDDDYISLALGTVAVFLGMLNISGGFLVTGRMLNMFSGKKKTK